MKVFKKIVSTVLAVLVLAVIGGYIYFDRKFTPDNNYLTVENESGFVPLTWLGLGKNVLLLPVHFEGDSTKYYVQFDTGSPYTVFYSQSIKNISQVTVSDEIVKTSFYIGEAKITSDKFKIYNQGKDKDDDSLKIIGTVGADILEDRKTLLNFKENYIAFNLSRTPDSFQNKLFDFEFNKRKIIFNGFLKGKEEKFLFDSGTSAYELLTNKDVWGNLKHKHSKLNIEKSTSWDKVLTAYTANCNQAIQFPSQEIALNSVTYVEGFSQAQYAMMKFSGMTGMLGNKIFLSNILYFDCTQFKMGIN